MNEACGGVCICNVYVFLQFVDPKDEMPLETIEKKLKGAKYSSSAEFLRDICQITKNAIAYNTRQVLFLYYMPTPLARSNYGCCQYLCASLLCQPDRIMPGALYQMNMRILIRPDCFPTTSLLLG